MKVLFEAVNDFFGSIVGFSDLLWDFPKNFEWYANIPVLGQIPFAIFLLIGMGIYFTIKTKGVQFRFFKHGLRALLDKKNGDVGVSQLASFMLSTAERVGPGNIMGVPAPSPSADPALSSGCGLLLCSEWPVPLLKQR